MQLVGNLVESKLILYFKGGLGNQLFQLCAGLSIARKLGVPLKFDDGWYNIHQTNTLANRSFKVCDLELIEPSMKCMTPFWISNPNFQRIVRRLPSNLKESIGFFEEISISDSEKILKCRVKRRILSGYWMNPPILQEIETLKISLDSLQQRILKKYPYLVNELKRENTVTVHIRLGDYKNFPEIFDVLNCSYFETALKFLKQGKSNYVKSEIIVFTDDPDEAKFRYGSIFAGAKWITSQEVPDELDTLLLMSLSNNLICANSSFSWWAAVSGNRSKKVVFPFHYTRNQSSHDLGLEMHNWKII